MTTRAFVFGPFRLDLKAHRLLRGGVPVALSERLVDVLAYLADHAGELVTREQLLDALWPGVYVTDNTVSRAISDLRQALGDTAKEPEYIRTAARRGYRFVAAVVRDDGDLGPPERRSALPPEHETRGETSGVDPRWHALKDLVAAIADLESFDVGRIAAARTRLHEIVVLLPEYAPARVALANACALAVEETRTGLPDRAAVADAIEHARRGCALDPDLGEAWATLAFVLAVTGGEPEEARAAARRAVMLDPASWRNQFRLAYASWGEERLRAVTRTLALMPGIPFACFTGAMVHVARGAMRAALDLLAHASPSAPVEQGTPERLPSAGIDWLSAAVLGAGRDAASRQRAFEHAANEIRAHVPRQLHSTEFVVNAWHWQAGWLYQEGNRDAARLALLAALALDPGHARSTVALAGVVTESGEPDTEHWQRAGETIASLRSQGRLAEAATCAALRALFRGEPDIAVGILDGMLANAPAGHSGWTLPTDPWLWPLHGTPGYTRVLHRLAQRAV